MVNDWRHSCNSNQFKARGHHDMVLLRENRGQLDTTAAAQGAESHGAGTSAGVYELPGVIKR